ncbi:MAG: glycosyltransferase [bacterium]|nr:glycosyltransferase [bacterium]
METEKPLITIITVVYNSEKYLEQALQSVISQGCANVEYIIIDGGSTDGTLDIIRKYHNHIAYWDSEADKGIFDAMNKGLAKASGDYIGMLNADDWYEPGILKRVKESIENLHDRLEPAVIYCDYYRYDEEMGKTPMSSTMEYWKGMTVSHQAMFIAATIYDTLGPYDLDYRLASDYDYFLRMISMGVCFRKINCHGVTFRMSGQSVTNMKEAIQTASKINRKYFGFFSAKHMKFIAHNHIPSFLGKARMLSDKIIGKERTAKLRKLWRRRP